MSVVIFANDCTHHFSNVTSVAFDGKQLSVVYRDKFDYVTVFFDADPFLHYVVS